MLWLAIKPFYTSVCKQGNHFTFLHSVTYLLTNYAPLPRPAPVLTPTSGVWLHLLFDWSLPSCLRSASLSLSLWCPVDGHSCNTIRFSSRTCQIHLHCHFMSLFFVSSSWHCSISSWLEMVLGQNIQEILQRHVLWKTDNLLSLASVIHQHSELYGKVDGTQLW